MKLSFPNNYQSELLCSGPASCSRVKCWQEPVENLMLKYSTWGAKHHIERLPMIDCTVGVLIMGVSYMEMSTTAMFQAVTQDWKSHLSGNLHADFLARNYTDRAFFSPSHLLINPSRGTSVETETERIRSSSERVISISSAPCENSTILNWNWFHHG